MTATHPSSAVSPAAPVPIAETVVLTTPAEIDASCRRPVLFLIAAALGWLTLGSIVAVLASIKMHAPGMLADAAFLTVGRLRPAGQHLFLYGFACQAALGIALWLFLRLGRNLLTGSTLLIIAALFWNGGVAAGFAGILAGDSSGFEWLEMPRYAAGILFASYVVIAAWALFHFAWRPFRPTYVSQWYLLSGLLWFAWIFAIAVTLLLIAPVRGTFQSAVNWWYMGNFSVVFLGMVGMAIIYYFLPKLTGRTLHSHYLALIGFWLHLFAGTWIGIPAYAPLPAWMSALSTAFSVIFLIPIFAAATNWKQTIAGAPRDASITFRFIKIAASLLVLATVLRALGSFRSVAKVTQYTLLEPAVTQLYLYGFFAFAVFGAIYFIVPRLTGVELCSGRVKAHFLCSIIGLALIVGAFSIGGLLQGFRLNDPNADIVSVVRKTIPFVGMGTLGALLLVVGHVALFDNVLRAIASSTWKVYNPRQLFEAPVETKGVLR